MDQDLTFDRGVIFIWEDLINSVELDEYDVYLMIYMYRLYTIDRGICTDIKEPFGFFPNISGSSERSETVNWSGKLLESMKKMHDIGLFRGISLYLHKNFQFVWVFHFDGSKPESFTWEAILPFGGLFIEECPFDESVEASINNWAVLYIEYEIDVKKSTDIFNKIINEYKRNQWSMASWPLISWEDNLKERWLSWRKQLLTLKKTFQEKIKDDPLRWLIRIDLNPIPESIQIPEAILCFLFDQEYKKEGYDIDVTFFDMYPVALEVEYALVKSQNRVSSRRRKTIFYDENTKIIYIDGAEATNPLVSRQYQPGIKRKTVQPEVLFLTLYNSFGNKVWFEEIPFDKGTDAKPNSNQCYEALKVFRNKVTSKQGKKKGYEKIEIIKFRAKKYWIDSDVYEKK